VIFKGAKLSYRLTASTQPSTDACYDKLGCVVAKRTDPRNLAVSRTSQE